jgi:hypothetical protein
MDGDRSMTTTSPEALAAWERYKELDANPAVPIGYAEQDAFTSGFDAALSSLATPEYRRRRDDGLNFRYRDTFDIPPALDDGCHIEVRHYTNWSRFEGPTK